MPLSPEQKEKIHQELERSGLAFGFSARSAGMRLAPESFDQEASACRFVASTEQPAMVWDWERWDFVNEVLLRDGMVLPESGSVRLLDTHSRGSVQDVLGSATDFQACKVGDFEGTDCAVTFSSVAEGRDAATKVREGHITDVSVGYMVTESYWLAAGEKQKINGKEYEGPVKVSTRWEPRELSLVPIGADNLAKVRSLVSGKVAEPARQSNHEGEKAMKKCPDCGNQFDGAACACGHRAAPVAPNTPAATTAAAPSDTDIRAQVDAGITAERERVTGITDACTVAGLDVASARALIDSGASLDQARARIIEELKVKNQALGAGASRIEVGAEEGDKFRAAAVDGLLTRGGLRIEKPAPGYNDFRGIAIIDLARQCLERSGINTRGLDKRGLAARALSPASSSDFPALMSAVARRHLLAAYGEAAPNWRQFVAVTDATDFKNIYGIKLSESPDLEALDENGEYKTAKFADKQETYRVITKGKRVQLTRVMIINDDLRAFTRIPMLFGAAARRMESDAVYGLITGNPVMSDGKALFHADHKNIETTTALKTTVNSGSLSSGRTIMRKQKGMNGATLDLSPAFVLAPLEQETDADILLRSAALPEASMSSGVVNPWGGKLIPVTDARLSAVSAKTWYLLAHPNQAPVIEVAYLMGEEQPYIDEEVNFNSDALDIKVRHDFGAGIVDHVGIFRNPGE